MLGSVCQNMHCRAYVLKPIRAENDSGLHQGVIVGKSIHRQAPRPHQVAPQAVLAAQFDIRLGNPTVGDARSTGEDVLGSYTLTDGGRVIIAHNLQPWH